MNFVKFYIVISLIFSTSIGFSKSSSDIEPSQKSSCCQSKNSYKTLQCNQLPAYNAPARIDVQAAFNFIVSASFIYWMPEMVGVDLGYEVSTDLETKPHEVVNFDTDYYPGFKILLGTHYDYDNWNINARYTRYHAKEKDRKKEDVIFHIFSESFSISPLETHWKPRIDYFDLEVGRPYYNGKHLVIKPYICVKGGWMNQRYKMSATLTNVDQEAALKTKSWFLGPRGALDINFLLSYDFRIFTNTSVSLMYQKFKTKDTFITTFFPLEFTRRFRSKSIQLTPAFEVNPGIGWSSYFDHNNWHLDAFLAYNFLYFFNQNEFVSVNAQGDFMLHGVELSLRLDF